MKYQTLQQIRESLCEDLQAAEKGLEIVSSALKKADPDGSTFCALVKAKKRALDRVYRLRNSLDDFDSQEW